MKDILILNATVVITLPVFCAKCGHTSDTTPITLEIKCVNSADLPDAIDRHPNARIGTHFPVGWASFYRDKYGDDYHCPKCVKE